jgi:hypothetical protein
MRPPTISLVLTVHDRARAVSAAVAAGLRADGNRTDQTVIVLDRPTDDAKAGAREAYAGLPGLTITEIAGEPKWLNPARAMNAGLGRSTSELTIHMSSEVILEPGAVDRCRELLGAAPAVLFGKCVETEPGRYAGSTASGILCSAEQARPLGFIACIPTWALRATGGYDERFMDGYWYDDDDLFYRLWKLGLPFLFDDSVAGVHQSHPRPAIETDEGQAAIATNRAYIVKKHGSEHPMHNQRILGRKVPGKTLWVKDAAFITQHALKAWGFET